MIRILLNGANGHMGQVVAEVISTDEDLTVVAGVDLEASDKGAFPVYASYEDVTETADVIIDFSVAPAVDAMLAYGRKNRIPMVICTTGLSDEQLKAIDEASLTVPILRSGNMSLGINLLLKLVAKATETLYPAGFDPEIVEMHHKRKLDAPSGTAIMLADAVRDASGADLPYVTDRSDRKEARPHQELGITALRGGTVVGIHNVLFAGTDEVIEIKHTAYSRAVFAKGAAQAAKFLNGRAPGLYSMSDVIDG